jgi:stearoyl-CoA desaturase (Delta-9 desaturase)
VVGDRPHVLYLEGAFWSGLVWELKIPPIEVRRNEHRLGSRVIERAAAQLAGSFDPLQKIQLGSESSGTW